MATDRLDTLRGIYDARAPTYDQEGGFHDKQATDYVKWMRLKPGDNVLDLACGTAAITVPAAQAVGTSGKVFGVDISSVSLAIARAKAKKAGVEVQFLEHDISKLHDLESYGVKENTFDVITCASALMLVADPGPAAKAWAKLLRKGGRIIVDVPTRDSNIQALVLERVAKRMGTEVIYERDRLESMQKLTQLLVDAGLDLQDSFVADHYENPFEIDTEKAGEFFEDILRKCLMLIKKNRVPFPYHHIRISEFLFSLKKPGAVSKYRFAFRRKLTGLKLF